MDSTEALKKRWDGKFIILGVTGSIAAYKSAEILRRIQDQGAEVQVMMTKTATKFMSTETMKQLSGHKVLVDIFDDEETWQMGHISLSDKADAFLIAPATGNILGKMANGIADDLVSTTYLAFTKPVVIAPSMNDGMYTHPANQVNLKTLRDQGVILIPPAEGYLACRRIGTGRLAETEDILGGLGYALQPTKDLKGKRVLVNAGPTQEAFDPVRYITNPSTGKMGFAIAKAAYQRGAEVTLVTGPTQLRKPFGVKTLQVRSAAEMKEAVLAEYSISDITILTAAVCDYKPSNYSKQKIKKSSKGMEIKLEATPDILFELGKLKENQFLAGFAAETENLLDNAKKKLTEKNLDLIAVNDVSRPDIGFGSDNNAVTLISTHGKPEKISPQPKIEIADIIFNHIIKIIKGSSVKETVR